MVLQIAHFFDLLGSRGILNFVGEFCFSGHKKNFVLTRVELKKNQKKTVYCITVLFTVYCITNLKKHNGIAGTTVQ